MKSTNTITITSPYLFGDKVFEMPCEHKVSNKKKGKKSEVYPFQVKDAQKMIKFFKSHEMWTYYLVFVVGINMARRIGDTLSLKWEHFYDPYTGLLRDNILEIIEDKTDKLANPRINSACREAIKLYLEKTGIDPAENDYKNYVFIQITGNYKGRVITADAYRKNLKKVAKAIGVPYNVGTHSTRKTFGMLSRKLHPTDYDSMELLQTIYNHSDTKTTKNYIGLTKEKVDKYYDDMGEFFENYIEQDNEYKEDCVNPFITIELKDVREIVQMAYSEGIKNAKNADMNTHLRTINNILSEIDKKKK